MTTLSKRIRVQTFHLPKPGDAPLEELKRRATELRRAIPREKDIASIADLFHDGLAGEALFHQLSRDTDDPSFHALLGEGGVLGVRYGREPFERKLMYCPDLGLFHGSVRSPYRIGCAFQFEGDSKGVIAISPFSESKAARTDYFRYTVLPSTGSFTSGGLA